MHRKSLPLLLVSGCAFALPSTAWAQGSPALIEQISVSRGSTPQLGATGSSTSERLAPTAQAAPQPSAPSSSVPPEVIAACESEDETAERPEGVDCAALLQQLSQARRPGLSAEMTLLGFGRPDSSTPAGTSQQAANSINADDVARQASTGDLQNPGASNAIGAIVQQGGGPR